MKPKLRQLNQTAIAKIQLNQPIVLSGLQDRINTHEGVYFVVSPHLDLSETLTHFIFTYIVFGNEQRKISTPMSNVRQITYEPLESQESLDLKADQEQRKPKLEPVTHLPPSKLAKLIKPAKTSPK